MNILKCKPKNKSGNNRAISENSNIHHYFIELIYKLHLYVQSVLLKHLKPAHVDILITAINLKHYVTVGRYSEQTKE